MRISASKNSKKAKRWSKNSLLKSKRWNKPLNSFKSNFCQNKTSAKNHHKKRKRLQSIIKSMKGIIIIIRNHKISRQTGKTLMIKN